MNGNESALPQKPPDHDPGPKSSYSDRLKMNVKKSERLSRKVLEITLEVDEHVQLKLEDQDVARLATRIGLDIPYHLEGYQICPGNSKKILLWIKDSCVLEKFCRDEVYRVKEGIKTGFIRPTDRKEVTVSIRGLSFNTPDTLVIEYLNKHGRVTNPKVIYDTTKEGPFKGIKNGDRKYQVDFSEGINLGSFHIIDGANVSIHYPGQRKTCGRCHENGDKCVGGGFAKICQQKGGIKVPISAFMLDHWKAIGFEPTNFKLPEKTDATMHEATIFTPRFKKDAADNVDVEKYTGVVIKNVPESLPDTEVRRTLAEAGLADDEGKVNINRSGNKTCVEIDELDSKKCLELITNLNESIVHGNKIFCRGLSELSSPITSDNGQNETSAEHKDDKKVEEEIASQSGTQNPEQSLPSTLDPIIESLETAETYGTESASLEQPLALGAKPKENPIENRPKIPGLSEIDRKKAEINKKKKLKEAKKNSRKYLDEFDFTDCEDSEAADTPKKSFSDLKSVFDNGKRKQTSPVESEKSKKTKSKIL